MLIVSGTMLVLATWLLAFVAVVAAGLPLAMLGTRASRQVILRTAMWWGLAVITLTVLIASLQGPLGGGGVLAAVLVVAGVAGAVGLWRLRSKGTVPTLQVGPAIRWLPLAIALSIAVIYLAAAALGPVTNYDSGLYHLGAVRYQQEFGLVPGLANLYFPLAYGNSVVPMAAFLGSTPWGLDGFRLFNGLLLVLLAVDSVLRIRARNWSPGTWLMVVATVFAWIPLTALVDYWVTSPTSDSAVLVLTIVSCAYLADAVLGRSTWGRDAGVASVTAVLLVAMRPTMVAFAAMVVAVIAVRAWSKRNHASGGGRVIALAVGTLAVAVAVTQALRDRILSGWFEYPLSVFAFDVPWRAPDPTGFRTATLGAARNPDDLWAAAEGWGWIPVWISRLPNQWEFWLLVLLILLSTGACILADRHHATWRPKAMLLAVAPSLVASVGWFVASPPSFRFGWGPLFTLTAIPAAFALAGLTRAAWAWLAKVAAGAAAACLVAVVVFSAVARMPWGEIEAERQWRAGPMTIPYSVALIPVPPTKEARLASGEIVRVPTPSDQCWAVYPMCAPLFEPTVTMPGPSIAEGFLP